MPDGVDGRATFRSYIAAVDLTCWIRDMLTELRVLLNPLSLF